MAHQDHTNQSSEVNTTDLHQLLSSYDAWPLQCNDLTEVLSAILREHGIEHTCMVGIVTLTGTDDGLPFHMWIDLPDGRRIDYRAQMWLGDRPEIPHGIFDPFQFPGLIYKGHPLPPEPFHPALFAVLVATEYSDEINQMKPYVERMLSGRERVSEYPPYPPPKFCSECWNEMYRAYAVPPDVARDDLSDQEIEELEEDLWLCAGGCGHYEYADDFDESWAIEVSELKPEVIQLPLPFPVESDRNYIRLKPKIFVASIYPIAFTHIYNHFFAAELSSRIRQRQ